MSELGRLLVALLVFAAVAGAQSSVHAQHRSEPRVVVTSKPIHALVADVMQGVASPQLLVEGSASPHTYSMRPSDAQKVSRADVLFRVSEALEPFTAKVVRALPRTVKVATLAEVPGVRLLPRRSGGPFEAHRHVHAGHGHKHSHGAGSSYDAHVWLDPHNAKAMVAAIAATLSERAPHHTGRFKANAEALSARLDGLAADLTRDLAPVAGRPFVVLHDAYQYFEQRFGLSAIGSIMVDPDEQPSARRITDLRKRVSGLSAVCVFAEPGHQPRVVSSVTEGTGARTAVLDPEGTMLEPGPELYFTLMRKLAETVKGCLATPV
jgi:zinc transport system substrate-binding protein